MIGLNHVLTGSAIGLAVKRPITAAILAVASHFVLDALPHWGNTPIYSFDSPVFPYISALDGTLTISALVIICYYAPPKKRWIIALCAFLAALPDASLLWYHFYGKTDFWFFNFHSGVQWCERPWGIIIEIIYAASMGVVVAKLIQKQRGYGHKSTSIKHSQKV